MFEAFGVFLAKLSGLKQFRVHLFNPLFPITLVACAHYGNHLSPLFCLWVNSEQDETFLQILASIQGSFQGFIPGRYSKQIFRLRIPVGSLIIFNVGFKSTEIGKKVLHKFENVFRLMQISSLQISLLRFFKKIHKFALCVLVMQILFHYCNYLGYFWLMGLQLMWIFSRTKSRIRQELSVLDKWIPKIKSDS